MQHRPSHARSQERHQMVREIERQAQFTASYIGRSSFSGRVTIALERVQRHEFVPPEQAPWAYDDRPLPIGFGQTISQPYIVALMTELLDLEAGDRVLEIGTGSGYQAAVLSELVARVYTIEAVEALAERASATLARLGYSNVEVRSSDGYLGWPEHAPYDAVMVTAGAPEIPPPLVEQLGGGGKLVIPVDRAGGGQELVLLEKAADGEVERRDVIPVAFVPLTRRRE